MNGNLYHYAGNNPVKYTDPTGMSIDDWQDNGDGTWTVKSEGAKLWDVWGADSYDATGLTEDEAKNIHIGDTFGKKNTEVLPNENDNVNSSPEPQIEKPNYLVQGLIGGGEVLLGIAVDIGTTIYAFGAEAAALETQKSLDPTVGATALSGYTSGALLMADGINMITSAFSKNKASPMIASLFKDIFLSSTYQDVGKAVEEYQKEKKNDK
ncbi:MAG: hypothetical protein HUJ68_06675 [Clostridia bacterium]|nr:hypothetical protein [Clostridia bacterium]